MGEEAARTRNANLLRSKIRARVPPAQDAADAAILRKNADTVAAGRFGAVHADARRKINTHAPSRCADAEAHISTVLRKDVLERHARGLGNARKGGVIHKCC